ncbi:hypothetical protein PRIPAC_73067, partial [Pristionchus pacificus]
IRNNVNQCIPINSCPSTQLCPSNEVYQQCGTACQPTCAIRNTICTLQCVPGCFCAQGYIRDSNYQCIPINTCPLTQTCSNNEVYRPCGTACQPTCENRNPPCTLQCVPGCQCAQGYIRNSQNQCIPVNSCPIICPANQIYRPCGTACEPTCDNRNPSCTSDCVPGCQCAQGYIRNANNLCVPVNTCPTPTCPNANEVWTQQCSCEQNCQQTPCAEFCISPRCQCAPGFVRNNGQCIRSWDCPAQPGSCDSNQVWTQCSTICEPSCGNFNPTCWSFACGPPKCQCSPNFYRRFDSPNADCVPWWQCRGRNTSPSPWEQWEGGRGRGRGRGRG